MDNSTGATQQSRRDEDGDAVALEPMQSTPKSSRMSPGRILHRPRPTLEDRRQPSIRMRRLPSSTTLRGPPSSSSLRPSGGPTAKDFADDGNNATPAEGNRRRSSSEPQRLYQWTDPNSANPNPNNASTRTRPRGLSSPMSPLAEEGGQNAHQLPPVRDSDLPAEPAESVRRPGLLSRASKAMGMNAMTTHNEKRREAAPANHDDDEYESNLVDYLDLIDPEVATLSTLTNVQNSLFIPNVGTFFNRRPTYTYTRDPNTVRRERAERAERAPSATPPEQTDIEDNGERPMVGRSITISSHLSETEDHYAVLPQGVSLKGWSAEEKEELNDHVRHMLHSRKEAFKRSMKGFGQYVRRPLGLFVTVYAFLITVFGLTWVLFLIGWVSVGGSQRSYDVNVIDNVLVALFAIMGDGLIPFRLVDTYHMIFIAHYHHLTWHLRKKKKLPKLPDHNDLPGLQLKDAEEDIEAVLPPQDDNVPDEEKVVLNPKQLLKLKHHQIKFAKSHTFYKPHETETHHAFPLRLLVAIVVLLDFHSVFQVALGTCTWAIRPKNRPESLTTVILCCSLACNITGGILISIGDKRTRKKDVIERMFRQQLTEDAMQQIEKRKQHEQERNEELNESVVPSETNSPTPPNI